jgi:hypothetical protein
MWDKVAAIDLRAKAEYYLVEHKPEGIERSAGWKRTVTSFA